MNRFRTKKRAKDDFAAPRPSMESDSSGPFKMFAKNKKSQDEPKAEVDIATALPSTDDFRTSLLMTGLSARFSMLREQDDPNTKMGKASDDSVLFPKRQSRLDFSLGGGLHDIAEVESIRAPFSRMDSYYMSDDAASTSGSIMNRAKPTEGNNLFGGRQKIYKIAAGTSSKGGGMSGRALYDDDVAQSSFQRWRQAERERSSLEDERPTDGQESDSRINFDRRRETNSTTSSAPSGARNSTAATSVASQPAPSIKDWQAPSSTTNTNSQGPFLERTVTRTRRLYEQGLTQDLHDQQSSTVSRVDTLSKRSFGSKTPDLTPTSASPVIGAFGDRPSVRHRITGKASAPNLRSFSPAATNSSQPSPAEPGSKFLGLEGRGFGTTPPLSPPISETGDMSSLSLQASDKGKITSMGAFNRTGQQYDDLTYVQRQKQLQQGRETPTNRFRTASNASQPTNRSRSSSSVRRERFEKPDATVKTEPTVLEEIQNHTFFEDDEEAVVPEQPTRAPPTPQVTLERPDDHDHPAFRLSALPTPLSVSTRNSLDSPLAPEKVQFATATPRVESPEDSPTLGPPSGLSGMVRQHLRNDSTASSVYGAGPDSDADLPRPIDTPKRKIDRSQLETNGWGLNESDWNLSYEDSIEQKPEVPANLSAATFKPYRPAEATSELPQDQEQDEFARHLADGARRVREKLTSYTDPDSGRSTPLASASGGDLVPPLPSTSSILKSKSSQSSLTDRKSEEQRRSGSSYGRTSSDANKRGSQDDFAAGDRLPDEKEEKIHAGLKAFRQARRELQKMKQIDVQQRRQGPSRSPHSPEQPPSQRAPSQEHGSVRSASRAESDRERSGSETSNGRPPYPLSRKASSPYEGFQGMNGSARQSPMMRSPMPPSLGTPPAGPYRTNSSQNLDIRPHGRGYDSGQPSPISPLPNSLSSLAPGSNAHALGSTASTPNLHSAASAPPLPPINPRRKTYRGASSHYGDDDAPLASPRIPTSPERQVERTSALVMPDDKMAPEQFRQRLRKVSADANGIDARARPSRTSPPRMATRSSQPGIEGSGVPNGLPGGMI